MIKDQYVAVLWARSVPWALAWRTCGLDQAHRTPTGYYEPTFSWAASEGEIHVPNYSEVTPSDITTFLSSSFIRHREKSPYSVADQHPTISGNMIFKDDVFGPLSSRCGDKGTGNIKILPSCLSGQLRLPVNRQGTPHGWETSQQPQGNCGSIRPRR